MRKPAFLELASRVRDRSLMSVHAEQRTALPLQWQVNSLQLKGLSWGSPDETPLLALHGWLDNAASFARLGPLLSGYYVVALDLTGHGQSARRSEDASYQIWDDLPEILGVLDQLGWENFDLLGHSRGAIISTLLASAFPERVNHLVLLDALFPAPVEAENFSGQMRRALQEKPELLSRSNRVFASVDEAVASRSKRGLSAEAARLLVERSVCTCPEGVTWTTDPRLHGASAVKLTEAQIRAVLKALCMPTLLMVAQNNAEQHPQMVDYAKAQIESLTLRTIEGGHHFHMESQASEAAQNINRFLATLDKSKCA